MVVDNENFVRKVEDQIALIVRPWLTVFDGVELKRQIISKGTIEREVGILITAEQFNHHTQNREYCGSP